MKLTTHPLGPDLGLTRIGTDQQLADRLRESSRGMTVTPDAFTGRFYENLFVAAPTMRRLFPSDLKDQRGKLLAMLQWIVANLEHRAELKSHLRELGER